MDKKKKNLLIGGLLAVVLLLAVGYAAFATTLTINGTSSIDSRWDVHIKDNGVNADPNHTVAADSVTAQKDSQLTGSFSCNLTTPGISTIDYIIEVENSGTFGAKLSSINITGETYYIGTSLSKSSLKQGDVIAGNGGSNTITVTVSYKDVDIVPTLAADKTVAITVTLNFVQDDGSAVATTNGGNSSAFNGTGTVYSWNTTAITVGTSQLTDLVSTKTEQPYYTSEADIQSALSGKKGSTIYNKYTVEDGMITEGYSCQTFGILSVAECVRGGNASFYKYQDTTGGNWLVLNELSSNSTFTGNNPAGSCSFSSSSSSCNIGNLTLTANSNGITRAEDDGAFAGCYIYSPNYGGESKCYE